jgi:osmoprotectant transport system ATP-binding protein
VDRADEDLMPLERLFNRIDSVRLDNVSKKYGERKVVDDLSLEIAGGELLILIGPSGSGKTTALRMINRLTELDEGRITINNKDIREFDPVVLRRNIGYVIQQIGLFPHMRVSENIGLIPKLEGWPHEKIRERIKELLMLVDLSPETFMNRFPGELSGGQQQRVGLARALAMDPKLLLMDEPFGALDPLLRKQLQEEFSKIKAELGRTIVFVTHDIEEAFKLGDRVAVINEGRLMQVGMPDELILNPSNDFVADLVDAQRKFRHMGHLLVKDVMTPIDEKNKKMLGDLSRKKIFSGIILADEVLLRLI